MALRYESARCKVQSARGGGGYGIHTMLPQPPHSLQHFLCLERQGSREVDTLLHRGLGQPQLPKLVGPAGHPQGPCEVEVKLLQATVEVVKEVLADVVVRMLQRQTQLLHTL